MRSPLINWNSFWGNILNNDFDDDVTDAAGAVAEWLSNLLLFLYKHSYK